MATQHSAHNLARGGGGPDSLIRTPELSDEQSCSKLGARTRFSPPAVRSSPAVVWDTILTPRQRHPDARRAHIEEIQAGQGAPPPAWRCDHRSCPISSSKAGLGREAGRSRSYVRARSAASLNISRNESDSRRPCPRVVGGAPRRAIPKRCLGELQRRKNAPPWQSIFGRDPVALVDGQTAQLLRRLLQHFPGVSGSNTNHSPQSPPPRGSSAPKTASRWSKA